MDDIEKKDSIRISTKQFGDLEIDASSIYNFKDGLYGFEDLHRFIIINEEETEPFKWLLSIDDPTIGFPILSPYYLDADYTVMREMDPQRYVIFLIITLQDQNGNITANMKAPIIFDVVNLSGEQIIIPMEKYTTDYIINKKATE
ncbi:MAG TPA: flagellar assembly protein FliW [Candidatus Kapabacteria bacterium]|jgi:flagellar assembly factor FliW|nr:flagellar assembly protein FliW [Candidatus Kapabacteria bacterium]HOV92972.1 flagellar assembly protein FliW [Candidatus Kapabacteria bacterium]